MSWFRRGDAQAIELPEDPGADPIRPATREWTKEVLSEEDDPDIFETIKMDGPPRRGSQEGLPPRRQTMHVLSTEQMPGRLMGAVWDTRDPIAVPGLAWVGGLLTGLGCGFVVGFGACASLVGVWLLSVQ